MAPRLDPLIAAVVAKIPGADATREQRIAWLRMIAMAMDNVHGAVGAPIDIPDFLEPKRDPIPVSRGPAARAELEDRYAASVAAPSGKQVIVPPGMAPLQPAAPPAVTGLTLVRTRFFIDRQGIARSDPGGQPANFADGRGEIWFDERGESGDLGAILWADGSTGVAGKPIEVSAAARKAG